MTLITLINQYSDGDCSGADRQMARPHRRQSNASLDIELVVITRAQSSVYRARTAILF